MKLLTVTVPCYNSQDYMEYNISLSELRKNLKIDMVINPENATAIEITRLLRFPAATNIESFCRGKVELMGFRLQEGDFLIGKPLYTLGDNIKKLSRSAN